MGLSLVASYPPKDSGVRQYTLDDATKELIDIQQFFYSVRESNATGKIEWKSSWKASDDGTANRSTGAKTTFLTHNLCVDRDMIGAAGTALPLAACQQACAENPRCRFFGWEALPFCIMFSNCTARTTNDSAAYTTYELRRSDVVAAKITAADLLNISMEWKHNTTCHARTAAFTQKLSSVSFFKSE